MAKSILAREQKQNLAERIFVLAVIIITYSVLPGCSTSRVTVTDKWSSRWFYSCDIPLYWVKKVNNNYNILILPWKDFNKTVWDMGFAPKSTRAMIAGTTIYLREDYTMDNYYHEIAHSWDNWNGRFSDHGPKCWTRNMPYQYEIKVLRAFADITLPQTS